MSLLASGPHTVVVQARVKSSDSMGETYKLGPKFTMSKVAVQPIDATEADVLGVQAATSYRVIGAGRWPGGPLSQVTVTDGPRLGLFDQQGEARHYGMSPRTAHFDVLITARGTEAK